MQNNKTGFTLLELLVVVLIIGILTGIALPQYRLAVGRAKLSSIKNAADSIVQAEQRYYLVHDEYTTDLSALDIEVPSNTSCLFGLANNGYSAHCSTRIQKTWVSYSRSADISNRFWRRCIVHSRDENDIPNTVCKQDTGGNAIKPPTSSYIYYNY